VRVAFLANARPHQLDTFSRLTPADTFKVIETEKRFMEPTPTPAPQIPLPVIQSEPTKSFVSKAIKPFLISPAMMNRIGKAFEHSHEIPGMDR
jgi:hypothetical protein